MHDASLSDRCCCREACTCIYDRRQSCSCRVGETKHPMLEEHFIEDYIKYKPGTYRKQLNPGQEPAVILSLGDGEQVEDMHNNLHDYGNAKSIYTY